MYSLVFYTRMLKLILKPSLVHCYLFSDAILISSTAICFLAHHSELESTHAAAAVLVFCVYFTVFHNT
jgi:hypothetical protein